MNLFQKLACQSERQPFHSAHTLKFDPKIEPYSLAKQWPIMIVLYFLGIMGSPLLRISTLVCSVKSSSSIKASHVDLLKMCQWNQDVTGIDKVLTTQSIMILGLPKLEPINDISYILWSKKGGFMWA